MCNRLPGRRTGQHCALRIMPLLWLCLVGTAAAESDVDILTSMIAAREQAMIEKDVETALAQFSDDAMWINSQAYYFEGKLHVRQFYGMLAETNPLDYTYEAGRPHVRLLGAAIWFVIHPECCCRWRASRSTSALTRVPALAPYSTGTITCTSGVLSHIT